MQRYSKTDDGSEKYQETTEMHLVYFKFLCRSLWLQLATGLKAHHQLISAGVNSIFECDTVLVILKQYPLGKTF